MTKISNRYCHLDMAKGILISLVVLGHILSDCFLNKVIFLFHVPAFFILSGIFLKEWDVTLKEELCKKWKRLIVPYFVYSLLLGTFARGGNVIKQIIGTVWGAGGNITSLTFCYYFVTVLFLSIMAFYLLNRWVPSRGRLVVIGVVYLLMQVLCYIIPERYLNFVPWNADMACYALVFLTLGFLLKDKFKQLPPPESWRIVVVNLLCVILIICQYFNLYDYSYNFKSHRWMPIIDIIVPLLFTYAIVYDLKLVEGTSKVLADLLAYVGKASLTILFLHPLFMHINKEILFDITSNVYVLTVINVTECCLMYRLLSHCKYSRFLT